MNNDRSPKRKEFINAEEKPFVKVICASRLDRENNHSLKFDSLATIPAYHNTKIDIIATIYKGYILKNLLKKNCFIRHFSIPFLSWLNARVYALIIKNNGTAGEVLIKSSSGFDRLDNAAVETVKKWRFIPAYRGKEAIQASVIVPVEFKIV